MGDNQVTYSVLVGNIGLVLRDCQDKKQAEDTYNEYVRISKTGEGSAMAYQEQVSLWSSDDPDPIEMYEPEIDDDMPYCYDCHDFINVEPTIAYRVEYDMPLCDSCFERRQGE